MNPQRVIPRSPASGLGSWHGLLDSRRVIASPAIVAYASSLAGRAVTVQCNRDQSFDSGELGYTLYDSSGTVYPVIYLPATMCKRLNTLAGPQRLVARRGRTAAQRAAAKIDVPDGTAVDTLIHEATHILEQSTNEARVECDSYRNRWSAVRLFGLSSAMDAAVMRGITVAHLASPASYLRDC
jgi:hypothetical protein